MLLTHPSIKKVGQIWDTKGLQNLSDLRQSIISTSNAWAKKFPTSEQQEQADWFKGACFEIWGEFFVKSFGTNPKVGIYNYSPIPKVEDRGVDGWGVDLSENKNPATAQFKFRSKTTDLITYEEIAKFRDQSREDYGVLKSEQMVVITTANDFNDVAKGQARGMRLLGFNQIDDLINGVPNPQFWNAKFWQDFHDAMMVSFQKPKRNLKEPFPHQTLMFKAMREFMESEKERGYILCGTGGGKTLAMSMITEWYLSHEGQQILIVAAPRIQLVNQIAKEFHDQQSVDFEWLTFHSGSPAETERYEDDTNITDASSCEYEEERTRQMGGLSTTNESYVASWVRSTANDIIIFTTYHSSEKLLGKLTEMGVKFVYFGDECHNLVTPRFSQILDFDMIKFIGFTATIEETEDPSSIGMNNYTRWGSCISEIKAADLVNLGITVPPKAYIAHIESNEEIEDLVAESTGQIIRRFKDEVCTDTDCRVIINCTSCTIAHRIAEGEVLRRYLPEFERLVVTSYRDLMGARSRDKELKKFANATNAVIFHFDMLGEGIDIPGVTAVMSWRDLCLRDCIQLIGRAGRIIKKDRENLNIHKTIHIGQERGWIKPYAYILCPLLKDNLDSQHAYGNMIRTINRLREDGRPISHYVHGATSSGRLKTPPFPEDKDCTDEKPDSLTMEAEKQGDVSKVFSNLPMEDILRRIEASLAQEREANVREIVVRRTKVVKQFTNGQNLSNRGREIGRELLQKKKSDQQS